MEVSTYAEWREAARSLLRNRVSPDQVYWNQPSLFTPDLVDRKAAVMLPRTFLTVAETVARHSDPSRWSLLYRVAWRIHSGERHLLEIDTDDDVMSLNHLRRTVEKDIYRMRAFVRFRKVGDDFVAWYAPEHHTLEANAKFFVDRFGGMRWAILTPEASLVWDMQNLRHGPGVPRTQAPADDELEDLWRLYYSTIYNPARLSITAMRAQLPMKRWIDLPESRTIPGLIRESRGRVQNMIDNQPRSAADFIPASTDLNVLREAIPHCGGCRLCARATQPVFGEGPADARIMFVGEQPGGEEDRTGRPFVGPAGQVFDRALGEAGVSRDKLYITNAVKAFIFEERGKRRIHQTPKSRDIAACRPWLNAEIQAVRPEVIVCLGASAAESVYGRKVRIADERQTPARQNVIVSYHPSAVLRAADENTSSALYQALVQDLSLLKQT